MPAVEPPALVHELEEAPDVFDVRVREGVVVVAPIHPLAEPLRPADELLRRPGDLSRHLRANSASPYSSISRFELRPSSRSTPTSIQRP